MIEIKLVNPNIHHKYLYLSGLTDYAYITDESAHTNLYTDPQETLSTESGRTPNGISSPTDLIRYVSKKDNLPDQFLPKYRCFANGSSTTEFTVRGIITSSASHRSVTIGDALRHELISDDSRSVLLLPTTRNAHGIKYDKLQAPTSGHTIRTVSIYNVLESVLSDLAATGNKLKQAVEHTDIVIPGNVDFSPDINDSSVSINDLTAEPDIVTHLTD